MKRNAPFLLVNGFQVGITVALLVIAVVFTIFPAALEHTPIGFETRGVIHHAFHYMLLSGAALTFLGLLRGRPRVEMVGLILLIGAVAVNLLALITDDGPNAQEGMAVAIRSAVLFGLGSRLYLIAVFLPQITRQAKKLAE